MKYLTIKRSEGYTLERRKPNRKNKIITGHNILWELTMKTLNIKQLDEKDEEIADALMATGMSRNVARTLSYLQNVDKATSVELEKGAGLHQPEVSIAMKQLKERDWIKEWEQEKADHTGSTRLK